MDWTLWTSQLHARTNDTVGFFFYFLFSSSKSPLLDGRRNEFLLLQLLFILTFLGLRRNEQHQRRQITQTATHPIRLVSIAVRRHLSPFMCLLVDEILGNVGKKIQAHQELYSFLCTFARIGGTTLYGPKSPRVSMEDHCIVRTKPLLLYHSEDYS